MGKITTLAHYKEISDPDLSSISTTQFAFGSKVLRQVSPLYIANKDIVTDKLFDVDSLDGNNVIRPRYTKSGFSTIAVDKIMVELEERVHSVEIDHRQLEEDRVEMERYAISACANPVIDSLIKELDSLLHDNTNYVTAREVDVDATGTPANAWTAPTTCTPLTNIRLAFDKFIASAKIMESDPNMMLFISPKLAKLVVQSTEYKTEVSDRKIAEPTLLRDRLEAVLNRRVLLAEGYYYGRGGSVSFDEDATCHVVYVDNPMGTYTDISSYLVNNSTFITGLRNLNLYAPQPTKVGEDEIFRLSGSIIATWQYGGLDKVTLQYISSLMRGTVWVHNISRLVRLKDII